MSDSLHPMDCSLPSSSVYGILQASILEWLPCPPPGDLPDPRIEPGSSASPALAGGFFTTSAVWEALMLAYLLLNKDISFIKASPPSIVAVPLLLLLLSRFSRVRLCATP